MGGEKPPAKCDDAAVYIPLKSLDVEVESRIPQDKWKCFLAFVYLVVSMLTTVACIIISNQRLPDRDKHPALPDAWFEVVERFPQGITVAESIATLITATWWLVVFFHKHRFILIRRAFLLIGTLYIYRCVTFLVTSLPAPYPEMYCPEKSSSVGQALQDHVLGVVFSGSTQSGGLKHRMCGNYIFSGHTMFITLHSLLILEYSPRSWVPLHWATVGSGFTAVAMILAAHEHYTVDVIIAYYITSRLFYMYHAVAASSELKRLTQDATNMFQRMWWHRPVCFFEENVHSPIPTSFDCPIPQFMLPTRIPRLVNALVTNKS